QRDTEAKRRTARERFHQAAGDRAMQEKSVADTHVVCGHDVGLAVHDKTQVAEDRKSTRLNSSHVSISYAVFCLKKKKIEEMNNETQKEIAGIQSSTSRQTTKDQVYAQNEMLAYLQKNSPAHVSFILEDNNHSKL